MPKVTEEHAAARRRQIVQAAAVCFARDGFHRATMQDIFKEAGLSPGAVYSYFKGKEEIVAAIGELGVNVAQGLFAPPAEGEPASLDELIDRLIGQFEAGGLPIEGAGTLLPQLFAEAIRSPVVLEQVHRVLATARSNFAAAVTDGQEAGAIDSALDPDAVARTLIALFHGFVLQRAWYPDMDVGAYRAAARAMAAGLSARPAG